MPIREADPSLGKSRDEVIMENDLCTFGKGVGLFPDLPERFPRCPAVRCGRTYPRFELVLEASHPGLEEVVEVVGKNGHELGPFQKGERGVLGHIQQPGQKVQLRKVLGYETARILQGQNGAHGSRNRATDDSIVAPALAQSGVAVNQIGHKARLLPLDTWGNPYGLAWATSLRRAIRLRTTKATTTMTSSPTKYAS